jgi:hypothetical protein
MLALCLAHLEGTRDGIEELRARMGDLAAFELGVVPFAHRGQPGDVTLPQAASCAAAASADL